MPLDTAYFIGASCALASGFAWALGAVLFKHLGEMVHPVLLTFCKGILSIPFLFVATLFVSPGTISANAVLILILSGFLGITLGDTFFFAALRRLPPVTLLVFLVLGQVLTALLSVAILGERLPLAVWIGLTAVVTGVVIVMYTPPEEREQSISRRMRWEGFFFAFLATIAISVSFIIMKPALAEINALHATFLRMTAAMVLLVPYLAVVSPLRHDLFVIARNRNFIIKLIQATVVVTFGGFYMSIAAFKYTSVPVASALSATDPIFALFLTWLMLKTPVSAREVFGCVLAVFGIVGVYLGR